MYLYNIVKCILNVLFRLVFRIEVYGKDNISRDGKLVLCSNHRHIFDPIIISMVFPRQIFWMAKKEIFNNRILSYFLIKLGAFPVDRKESDLSAIKNSLRVLKKEGVLGIFPEGTRVKDINIENVKPGVALISVKSQSKVLPVYIEGSFKLFSKIRVYFGSPMDFSSSYNKKLTTEDYHSLSKDILYSIYSNKPIEEGM